MHCIRCGGEMDKRSERGVLLDHCRACDAIWLDGGELEALELGVARSDSDLAVQREAEGAREAARGVSTVGLCPRCQRGLEPGGIHGIEIDRCRHCGGIFFDQRELPAVLARSRSLLAGLRRGFRRGEGPS
jgi:Zn-finger nucleic acid-binding protein